MASSGVSRPGRGHDLCSTCMMLSERGNMGGYSVKVPLSQIHKDEETHWKERCQAGDAGD